MKKILIFCTFAIIISGLFGCSERKEDTPLVQAKTSVHGEGFTDPSSANFHAAFVKTKNYDLQLCQSCHGADYSGGTTGQSCNTCHNKPSGPENCATCHGSVNAAPPKDLADNVAVTFRGVGAHQKHVLGGTLGAAVACKTCHVVPTTLKSPGHIDASMYAEVKFDTTSIFYEPIASYSPSSISCGNTYCHGNFNGGNQGLAVTWTDNSGNATQCGTCHGDITKSTLKEKAFPKTGHTAATVTSDCSTCHGGVVNASLAIINPAKHINGGID